MALKLRLARAGSKKRPYYHVVVADARAPRDGRFIERVGHYNPMLAKDSGERVGLNEERIKHWLDAGAQPTDRVLRFLDEAGLRTRAQPSNPKKGEPGQKAKERVEERKQKEEDRKVREEEERTAAAEAAEQAKAEAAAAAEAAKETASDAADAVGEAASDAAEGAANVAESVADAVTDTAAAAASAVAGAAASVIDAVTGGSDKDDGKKDDEKKDG